ncbi:MAG: outer membrane lipoprotein-sorting protein [Bacteriovoracaceae bacterium]|nr:outer membrane lipoprotein-sorting protein [Bacteriovoracaceae bacterium]
MKFLVIFLLLPTAFANTLSVKEVMEKFDKLYRSTSSYCEIDMLVETKNWKRTLGLKIWTKGMDNTLIHITSPKKDAGITTLRRDKLMWNYFPKINKVIKIPPSMMMGQWMGSDFNNDDLVKENTFLNDYRSKFIKEEDKEFYFIESNPKSETVSLWSKVITKIKKSDMLPIEQSFYDEKGVKKRIMEFSKIEQLGGKLLPTTLTLKPLSKNKLGNKTVIIYHKAQFNLPIKDSTFTRASLQKRR